jgi:hypothetical protein
VYIVKGETLIKQNFHGKIHIMRNPHAIFFDIAVLREAESLGAKNIYIKDKDSGNIYIASIADVWQYAICKDYGYGSQVGLAVNRFEITQARVNQSPTTTTVSFKEYFKRHPVKAEKQMSLFGGG